MSKGIPAPARGGWLAPATIALLAALTRGWHLLSLSDAPDWGVPLVDSRVYDALARGLAAGVAAGDDLFWQPVFYPLFLSAVYRTFGSGPLPVLTIQALIGVATAWLTWRVALERFGSSCGWMAGLIVALCGPMIFFEGQLLATGWAALFVLLLVWLAPRVRSSTKPAPWLLFGMLAALACLVRPTFVPPAAAICGWVALSATERRVRRASLCLLGFAALSLPVAWGQLATRDSFSILPASGGLNLFIGNNAASESTVAIRPGREWQSLTKRPYREGIRDRQGAAEYFESEARRWMAQHPLAFARGLGRKCLGFISSRELPRNLDLYVFREWSPLLRLTTWKLGAFGFPMGLVIPLAAIGLVLGGRRAGFPLIAMLALYSASVVLVFVSARYRAPTIPLLAILAAAGLTLLPAACRRTPGRALTAALAGAVTLLLATLPGPFPQEAGDYRAELHYLLGTQAMDQRQDELAARELRSAIERSPDHADAANHLGIVEVRLGDRASAVARFEQAVAIDPTFVTARLNLARTLAAVGRLPAALEQFREALALAPENLDVRYHMASTMLRAGRPAEAIPQLELILRARPENQEVAAALERARKAAAR